MPIVISRETGSIQPSTPYTPDQIDRAWEAVVRAWAQANQDHLRDLEAEYASDHREK